MTSPDTWGRVIPAAVAPAQQRGRLGICEATGLALLRAAVFLGGMFYAVATTFFLAYGGLVGGLLLLLQISLAPAALACWILASCTRAGDRWTLAYLSIWASEAVVVSIGATFFW